jgi:hypothetical protein
MVYVVLCAILSRPEHNKGPAGFSAGNEALLGGILTLRCGDNVFPATRRFDAKEVERISLFEGCNCFRRIRPCAHQFVRTPRDPVLLNKEDRAAVRSPRYCEHDGIERALYLTRGNVLYEQPEIPTAAQIQGIGQPLTVGTHLKTTQRDKSRLPANLILQFSATPISRQLPRRTVISSSNTPNAVFRMFDPLTNIRRLPVYR